MEQKNMLPGLTREAEEQKLQEIIGIAQQNLERARADIRKVNEDLEDLLDQCFIFTATCWTCMRHRIRKAWRCGIMQPRV